MRDLLYRTYSQLVGLLPDSVSTPLHFRLRAGYWPNLDEPTTFNEKIQYRKLHGDSSLYARLADKLLVKEHVGQVLGEEYVVPTYWQGATLPPPSARTWALPCVLKSNHGSGRNRFIHSEADLCDAVLDETAHRWMSEGLPPHLKERFYELIERRLFVEPMLGENIPDYKFYVFRGIVRLIHVDVDRRDGHKRALYDRNWTKLPLRIKYPLHHPDIDPPAHLSKMIAAAEELGATLDFVRVDLYSLPGGPKFGEMTFTPGGGFERFSPLSGDHWLGEFWRLEA
jgi:hypothetical protein